MNRDKNLRTITHDEKQQLIERGCCASDWSEIYVSDDFSIDQLSVVRLSGRVEIGRGVRIVDSYVANYSIDDATVVEGVTRLECRHASSFGVGVEVSTVNENGGRSVALTPQLTSQVGYIWAMNRHRTSLIERLGAMVRREADECRSTMGRVGSGCRVIGARFIREVAIGDDVTIDGASMLECGTILKGAYVGIDVKARDFILAEESRVDTGVTIERCFVGECSILASGFTAVDSLVFANSHFENGEAAAIFAGAHTVSHHKSSLLIAGLFSFFNAGSGSNQSNHLFKTGAVHQAIHSRGCKFASAAYVMAPAREGAFTMIMGRHSHHHDTSVFPYSYLLEEGGKSKLIPAANLTSYGTHRDISKWSARDKRKLKRDIINYEEYNPYVTSTMVRAINTLHTLRDSNEKADEYLHERVTIRASHLKRGVTLYNKAIAASLGAMLSRGEASGGVFSGEWIDAGGAYLPMSFVESVMDRIEGGELTTLQQVDTEFRAFAVEYDNHAHQWALSLLAQMMGHTPSAEEVATTIDSANRCRAEFERLVTVDRDRDNSLQMAVGYGNDYTDPQIVEADFRAVRGV